MRILAKFTVCSIIILMIVLCAVKFFPRNEKPLTLGIRRDSDGVIEMCYIGELNCHDSISLE